MRTRPGRRSSDELVLRSRLLSFAGSERVPFHGGENVGSIQVHEFMSLDGVIDTPTWTFDYGFDPPHGRGDRRRHETQPRHPARAHDVRDVRARMVDPNGR